MQAISEFPRMMPGDVFDHRLCLFRSSQGCLIRLVAVGGGYIGLQQAAQGCTA